MFSFSWILAQALLRVCPGCRVPFVKSDGVSAFFSCHSWIFDPFIYNYFRQCNKMKVSPPPPLSMNVTYSSIPQCLNARCGMYSCYLCRQPLPRENPYGHFERDRFSASNKCKLWDAAGDPQPRHAAEVNMYPTLSIRPHWIFSFKVAQAERLAREQYQEQGRAIWIPCLAQTTLYHRSNSLQSMQIYMKKDAVCCSDVLWHSDCESKGLPDSDQTYRKLS